MLRTACIFLYLILQSVKPRFTFRVRDEESIWLQAFVMVWGYVGTSTLTHLPFDWIASHFSQMDLTSPDTSSLPWDHYIIVVPIREPTLLTQAHSWPFCFLFIFPNSLITWRRLTYQSASHDPPRGSHMSVTYWFAGGNLGRVARRCASGFVIRDCEKQTQPCFLRPDGRVYCSENTCGLSLARGVFTYLRISQHWHNTKREI